MGLDAPAVYNGVEQMPVEGESFGYTFDGSSEPTRKGSQYFEMLGHRAIWRDGWKAVSWHPPGGNFEADRWELYHLDEDFSECNDLAGEHPERLQQLIDLWWEEAGKYNVLPLSDMFTSGFARPGGVRPRRAFTLYPGESSIPVMAAPNTINRSHRITAHVYAERSTG